MIPYHPSEEATMTPPKYTVRGVSKHPQTSTMTPGGVPLEHGAVMALDAHLAMSLVASGSAEYIDSEGRKLGLNQHGGPGEIFVEPQPQPPVGEVITVEALPGTGFTTSQGMMAQETPRP